MTLSEGMSIKYFNFRNINGSFDRQAFKLANLILIPYLTISSNLPKSTE
jgi:hypothetical protein